jgi:hypothetical protein
VVMVAKVNPVATRERAPLYFCLLGVVPANSGINGLDCDGLWWYLKASHQLIYRL